ncbi:dihydrodipicolinate synthase family protein [Oerskovia flava]|uniref:dihydrodipicolinate synthase family protein n=1 Tax=Oerskovia flava TaxID=2986422 RepID=UPI00223FE6B8|nr:dihydrodipicolinate synthase family protein [Oerskovia sp. JB1-3-2]
MDAALFPPTPALPAPDAAAGFRGLIAYPVTPLAPDGAPDRGGLARLVADALGAGVDAVTVLASSGAGVTFDDDERDVVVRVAVEAAGGAPVHVAVSAASTAQVLRNARAAEDAGASGLVLAPFAYLPLVDDEVRALVEAVGAVSALPLCFYNRPLQSGYDLSSAMLTSLVGSTTVVAVKDPASLPDRPRGRVASLRRAGGPGASVGLSGDVPLLTGAEPADAWHTGLAALAPVEYVAVRRARVAGDGATTTPAAAEPATGSATETARAWLADLAGALAAGRPLGGLHALAELLGTPTGPPRGPSLPATHADVERLRAVVARRPRDPR